MTDHTAAYPLGSETQPTPRDDRCPHRCGYRYPIPSCVRLHLIQHHNYDYLAAQKAYPDEVESDG